MAWNMISGRTLRRFAVSEDGGLLPFTIVIFLMMVVVTGMAIDLMRHETHRAEMQNALDRGLLAAADLDQDLTEDEAKALVKDYFRSALWLGKKVVPEVEVPVNKTVDGETGIGERELIADAEYHLNTAFLRIIGRPTMPVVVAGRAEEKRKDVELSLVLDISGTMRYCGPSNDPCAEGEERRMDLLIPAAQNFIDRIMKADAANTTTVNLIPYAGQVNVGPSLFSLLGGNRIYLAEGGVAAEDDPDPDYVNASCLELQSLDFDTPGLPSAGDYAQVPHFHHWNIDEDNMDWGWCPSDDVAMTVMNGVEDQAFAADNLKNRIADLDVQMHDGTGTNNAMYYALALLDPISRATLSGVVPAEYAGKRPVDWDTITTLKVIVLMTDGQITGQYRPNDPTDPDLDTEETQPAGNWFEAVSQSTAESQFLNICQDAKDNDVIVYTIAFYAPNGVKDEMRDCSTDPDTHFYDVQGLEIATAFEEIATTLSKVKLTK